MPIDVTQPGASKRLSRGGKTPALAARPTERAQIVWKRALELACPRSFHDRFANALDLFRTADHDSATMEHALTLGHTELCRDSDDAVARAATEILETAIVFLGVNPHPGDIADGRFVGTARRHYTESQEAHCVEV